MSDQAMWSLLIMISTVGIAVPLKYCRDFCLDLVNFVLGLLLWLLIGYCKTPNVFGVQ